MAAGAAKTRRAASRGGACPSVEGLRSLAEPYLRGFQPVSQPGSTLRGYWFVRSGRRPSLVPGASNSSESQGAGFFVGYLLRIGCFAYLDPVPPECLVGVFVLPVGGEGHRALVSPADSLFRRNCTYIGWLTHRRPRYVFSEDGPLALVRHTSMRDWPRRKCEHFSRNFFIESLASLVRSGLVKKLLAEPAGQASSRAAG